MALLQGVGNRLQQFPAVDWLPQPVAAVQADDVAHSFRGQVAGDDDESGCWFQVSARLEELGVREVSTLVEIEDDEGGRVLTGPSVEELSRRGMSRRKPRNQTQCGIDLFDES